MNPTPQQLDAIEKFGKNIIVSAGAGSGKTEVLSKRVLEHVKKGIGVDEMLILNFTNASAAEMKTRIRNKLIENNLIDQANKVDIAYITTFDSYALSILKKYSYVLNLSDNISIIDNSIIDIKKEEILRSIFNDYYESNNELFLELINDFCFKDDNIIFNNILSLNKELDNRYDKDDYLKNIVNNTFNDEYINELINKYLTLIKDEIKKIINNLNNMKDYTDTKFYNKYYSSLSSLINSNTYNEIKYNVNNIESIRLPNNSEEILKAIKKNIVNIIDDIKDLTDYNDINEIRESILSTKDYITIISQILLKLSIEVFNFKKSINSFEFVDIAKMAIEIVEQNEGIKNTLKETYKEILIDEYQDTSDLQEKFINLIENNNVYMVGDIKQSIYRFRNANPKLFKDKYSLYSNGIKGIKIDLVDNFRSRENVINAINIIFNLIMDEEIGGASYFDEHQMVYGLKAYDKINNDNYDLEILNYNIDKEFKYTKEEVEIFTIINDIKEKINNKFQVMDKKTKVSRNITYGDFAILIDKSKYFNLYKKIFEYFNIPLTIKRDSTLCDSIDLSIIKNIYNIIISIYNKTYDVNFRYSYVSIARSFLFNIDDNDIFKILNDNTIYNTDIFKICQSIANSLYILTNKQIYELILDKFDIYNKLYLIGDINNHLITLDSISDIINSSDNIGYSPLALLAYLNNIFDKKLDIRLSLNKDESTSVKIMTIHTSKGLEYPVVYLPSLDNKFKIEFKDKFYYSNTLNLFTPYKDNEVLRNSIIKTLYKDEVIKEEISEKLRLFYVALTRAREKLIFVTSLKENELSYKINGIIDNDTRYSYRTITSILNSIYTYIKRYIVNIDINNLNLSRAYKYNKECNIKIDSGNKISVQDLEFNTNIMEQKRLSKDIHEIYNKQEKDNIELGLRMHHILEITDFNNPNYNNLKTIEQELLAKFIDTKIFVGAKNIYKELEFMYKDDNNIIHGIIDLLLVFEDKNIIIDYKLKNTKDEAYIKQLNGYKKYIEKINKLPTDIYLYSIIDGALEKITSSIC